MGDELDWRLETREEPWMYGARFRWMRYRAPSDDWNHDHCALCWATFMDADGDDVLREGYLAQPFGPSAEIMPEEERTHYRDGLRMVAKPTSDQWVCPVCFEDFKERFGWVGV